MQGNLLGKNIHWTSISASYTKFILAYRVPDWIAWIISRNFLMTNYEKTLYSKFPNDILLTLMKTFYNVSMDLIDEFKNSNFFANFFWIESWIFKSKTWNNYWTEIILIAWWSSTEREYFSRKCRKALTIRVWSKFSIHSKLCKNWKSF